MMEYMLVGYSLIIKHTRAQFLLVAGHNLKGKKRFLEAYIIDFSGDIYGTRIKVSLVKKIRNEEVFSNIENLKKQMGLDCKEAIKILEENKI